MPPAVPFEVVSDKVGKVKPCKSLVTVVSMVTVLVTTMSESEDTSMGVASLRLFSEIRKEQDNDLVP